MYMYIHIFQQALADGAGLDGRLPLPAAWLAGHEAKQLVLWAVFFVGF